MNETIKQLFERKSVRVFEDKEISPEDKELILRAATEAPTAGNQQLYTIIDVTSAEKKARLAESCDHQPFIEKAKMVMIFCADPLKWYKAFRDGGCEPRDIGLGDLFIAVSDANIAAQNAVVAAHSLGIGSCYIGDIMENREVQKDILELPDYVFPAAMLVFGYPTEKQKEREKPHRADLKYIVSENGYPEMDSEYLRAMLKYSMGEENYPVKLKAFCERKYNSDFSREMTRSVSEYVKEYTKDGVE